MGPPGFKVNYSSYVISARHPTQSECLTSSESACGNCQHLSEVQKDARPEGNVARDSAPLTSPLPALQSLSPDTESLNSAIRRSLSEKGQGSLVHKFPISNNPTVHPALCSTDFYSGPFPKTNLILR